MPSYDFECAACGPFVAFASMAQCAEPCACPDCGVAAARAFIHTPMLSGMDRDRRIACETNERSSHEPKRLSKSGPAKHRPGCGCCGSGLKQARKTLRRPDGAKSFPGARPWMISH